MCVWVDSSVATSREVDAYLAERNKYKEQSQQRAQKGSSREAETLKMLAAFQSKMERSRKLAEYVSAGVADDDDDGGDESDKKDDDDDEDDDAKNLSWLVHGLCLDFSAASAVVVQRRLYVFIMPYCLSSANIDSLAGWAGWSSPLHTCTCGGIKWPWVVFSSIVYRCLVFICLLWKSEL